MKLRSLELSYFRQHVASRVEFPDGLTGVIGHNGSGKTTIVEAIGFALYGSRALRGKTEDVRTKATTAARVAKTKQEREPRVSLALEHDGTIFRIDRSLADASLYVGGEAKAVAVGNREVTTRISSIVGMSHEEFVATYCTEQKGLEFLSGKRGATEREKFIVRMMGYDRLEDMQELIRTDRKEKRAVLLGFESSLGSREELELRLTEEQRLLTEVTQRHGEAAQTLKKTEGDFDTLRERMAKLEDLRARYTKEKEAVQTIAVRLDERNKRLKDAVETASLLREKIDRAGKEHDVVGDVEAEANKIENAKKALLEKRLETESQIHRAEIAWREAVTRAEAEEKSWNRQAADLKRRSATVESLEGESTCPTCGQEVGGAIDGVLAHYKSELDIIETKISECRAAVAQISRVPKEIDEFRSVKKALDDQIAVIDARLRDLAQLRTMLGRMTELDTEQKVIRADIALLTESSERARAKMIELRFSEDDYLKEKGAFEATQRVLEIARLQRVKLEGEVNTRQALVSRTKDELSHYDDRRSELDKLRRGVRLLDEADRIVTDFRRHVNASIRPRMSELASEYLADLTDGRYTAVDLGDDFTPTVLEDGEPKPVISGGEEDILNLCMRISLSHMLAERAGQHFSLLILDEVFGSLDEGRRGNVLALLEKLRKRFEQILIITHLDDIKEGVQHLITVDYDEGTGTAQVIGKGADDVDGEMAINL